MLLALEPGIFSKSFQPNEWVYFRELLWEITDADATEEEKRFRGTIKWAEKGNYNNMMFNPWGN